jgi:hypothetical protein
VELGATRQSCDPSKELLFKLVLEVVLGMTDRLCGNGNMHGEHLSPRKSGDVGKRVGGDAVF